MIRNIEIDKDILEGKKRLTLEKVYKIYPINFECLNDDINNKSDNKNNSNKQEENIEFSSLLKVAIKRIT